MSASQKSLFRNVYQLVGKDGQQVNELLSQEDLQESTRGGTTSSNFTIQPIKRRVPIAEQYEKSYKETQKVSRNTRSIGLKSHSNNHNVADIEDQQFINLEQFILNDETKKFNTKTIKSVGYNHRFMTRTQSRDNTNCAGTSLTRERISLQDLRTNDVLTKIKNRCKLTNPGLFEDTVKSLSNKDSSKRQLTSQQSAVGLQQLIGQVGTASMRDFPVRKPTTQQVRSRASMASLSGLIGGQQLQKTNFSLVSNPSLEPHSNLTLMAPEEKDRQYIDNTLAAFERRMFDSNRFSRDDLRELLQNKFNLQINEITAIEGISFCRGKLMEKSSTFSREKLIEWLCLQIPILRTSGQIIGEQQEILREKKERNLQQLREKERDVKDQPDVEEVLKAASLNKRSKVKLVNSLMALDEELQEQKSRQGMLAQMAAQQRLIHSSREKSRQRRLEVKSQINDTCQFESAVRALNLQKHMNPSWSEVKNSYQVVSKLTSRQQRRLTKMMDNRLEFPK